MLTYRTALPAEREQYIAFANDVFTAAVGRPFHFDTLIPKVYGPRADGAEMQYMAVDDEKGIRALIATLPGEMHIGDTTLKTGYIGTVSSHPESRGEGHMKRLMQLNLERMRSSGTDLALLGGQRQRYSYFGYEPAGLCMQLSFSSRMAHHALADADITGLTFEEILPDTPLEVQAAALYRSQPCYADRDAFGFVTAARSYNDHPYAALQNGRFLGYVICGDEKLAAAELLAVSPEACDQIIKGWLTLHQLKAFAALIPGWDTPLIDHLWEYAEGIHAMTCVQAHILNYPKVAEALLKLKALYTPLEDGELALEADGCAFTLRVKDGQVSVREGASHPKKLSHREMHRLLLDPFYPQAQALAPRGWFPLPLYIGTPDSF